MNRRFTQDGSAALEQHLAHVCGQVRDGVGALVPADQLDGLLLGGGYGRGEGGVLRAAAGDQPYNDLEFYVFLRGNAVLAERKFRQPLHELGERLSPAAGLEVEFKVLTLDKLRRSRPQMFYYDLILGHRWLIGDDDLLAGCDHHRDAARLPLSEATRLLMNRASGLLFSAARLRRADFNAADADFVGRNLAKAQLAFGDVLLTVHGQYHWSCRERHRRLLALAADFPADALAAIRADHAAGVEFKLHPIRSGETVDALRVRHAELLERGRQLWLWLENRRLGTDFRRARDYAFSPVDKCPETPAWRNWLINLRTFRAGTLFAARARRYPRQRLFHALCLLLWETAPERDEAVRRRLHAELDTTAADYAGLVAAYATLWGRFN
jgi:hypothetical protein